MAELIAENALRAGLLLSDVPGPCALVIFGGSGWILALFGGRKHDDQPTDDQPADDRPADDRPATEARAASTDAPPQQSSPTATGRS